MPQRPTSQWVLIERVVPHPDNANVVPDDVMDKLRQNIGETGQMPPIIVRSLEASNQFTELFQQEKLQILDGEHRWKIAGEREAKEVEVRVWPNISDERAKVLLLTLNRLQGKDDPKKRNTLIRTLAEIEDDTMMLASILPETQEVIDRTLAETTRAAVANARQKAAEIGKQEPLTVFVLPEHGAIIRTAIKQWLDENDPGNTISECREGAALAGVCGSYVDSS